MAPHAMRRPAAQQQVLRRPAAQLPALRRPAAQQPALRRPAAQQPALRRPAAQHLVLRRPAAQQPALRRPAAQQPPLPAGAAALPSARRLTGKQPALSASVVMALRAIGEEAWSELSALGAGARRRHIHWTHVRTHDVTHRQPGSFTREEFPTGARGVPSSIGWPRAQERILRPPPPTPDIS